ncbi:MAG TPA: N-acetyltransferase [Actinomycetes bacterium]|nr:N-acetyltransferase [Actinomycetes bacterium]
MVSPIGQARAALPPAREIALGDGSTILVRPILPQDKQRLREGFARLSRASRYRRLMTPLEHLSDTQVRYLTEIDYVHHMAWVALDPTQPTQPGLGVARYIRLPDDPTTAEAAVTVIDEQQGNGIGTILLTRMADTVDGVVKVERELGWDLNDTLPPPVLLGHLGLHDGSGGSLLAGGGRGHHGLLRLPAGS